MTRDRFVHLHAQSWFSLRRGGSSPQRLVARAHSLGQSALAITDHLSVAGHVEALEAARDLGVNVVLGVQLPVLVDDLEAGDLVLLAQHRDGYAQLNALLTLALERSEPHLTLEDVERHDTTGLIALTGGRSGPVWKLLEAHAPHRALEFVQRLASALPGAVFLELVHHRRPGDTAMLRRLYRLARTAGLETVMTNDVLHATSDEWAMVDALNLSRLGLTVDDDSLERPWNDEARIKTRNELEDLIPLPHALDRSLEIAARCRVDLLTSSFRAPNARIPDGETPASYLEHRVRQGIARRYPPQERRAALQLMEQELEIIARFGLEAFFLAVHDIRELARDLGIRTAGRGSAAASVVVYALEVAHCDPLKYHLSFDRFLNPHRMHEPPDVDFDVQSSRRDELLEAVVHHFGRDNTAMTANFNRYGARPAIRDLGKVLGYPLETVDRLAKAIPSGSKPRHVALYQDRLEAVIGQHALLEVLIALVTQLEGCPRDVSLHSGGMLLAPQSLDRYSARFRSTGGTWQTMLNKDTAEAVGLIKMDILGLRILDVLEYALALLRDLGIEVNLDRIPFDDPLVYDGLNDGEVIGLFQIESPGMQALGAKLQPRDFPTLVTQLALHRPGAIVAGSVHPFIRRYRGLEPIFYPHPSLEPALRETLGVLVYQDQVGQIASALCGWDGGTGDGFRKALSKVKDDDELEPLLERFVRDASRTHADLSEARARQIARTLAGYKGYGFPRAHSLAFAITTYHTAFIRSYFPAAYLCACFEHVPGMYDAQTFRLACERVGVAVLPMSWRSSGVKYSLERHGDGYAIRTPFTAVQQFNVDLASRIVAARAESAFSSLEDFYRRVALPADAFEALILAGGFDDTLERRSALWQLGVLQSGFGPAGGGYAPLDVPLVNEADLLEFARLDLLETISLERRFAGSSAVHPVAPFRSRLVDLGVTRVDGLLEVRGVVLVAGIVKFVQRPETAHGTRFVLIEDETGMVQTIVHREAWGRLEAAFRGGIVVVRGAVHRLGHWCAVSVGTASPLAVDALELTG
jgi:error-prone DNA polymerase